MKIIGKMGIRLLGTEKYYHWLMAWNYWREKFFEIGYRQPKKMLDCKDRYKDERCFIVATGPSLTIDDLKLIEGEYSFSVNSIIGSFDKTEWRPNFYVITDSGAYNLINSDLDYDIFDKVFFPVDFENTDVRVINFIRSCSNRFKGYRAGRIKDFVYPTTQPDKYFQDGPSVVFIAIQIAVYMGFKELYLLGQDCDYSLEKQHSSIADYSKDVSRCPLVHADNFIECFSNYREFYDKKGINIYNCTRGGKLEVFERKRLEDVVAK